VISSIGGIPARRRTFGRSRQTVGTDADQLKRVLDAGEAGIDSQAVNPPLDRVGVDSPAEATASADQIMPMAGRRPLPVEPPARLIPYDVDTLGPLEIVQRAIHRGQADGLPRRTQQGMQVARRDEVSTTRQRLEDRATLTRLPEADVGRARSAGRC
jgi:hypothetical protein